MIAIESARLFRQLTGGMPRVAMLSYSTKGSAQTQDTEKIVAATAMANQLLFEKKQPGEIDGELQVDTALIKEIAEIKAPGSTVAGQANVLVFPDLNSGNIAVKLVHRLAGGEAYGQILLGLEKPAADFSRGASVHEIVGVAAIVSLQAIEYRRLYPEQGRAATTPLHRKRMPVRSRIGVQGVVKSGVYRAQRIRFATGLNCLRHHEKTRRNGIVSFVLSMADSIFLEPMLPTPELVCATR